MREGFIFCLYLRELEYCTMEKVEESKYDYSFDKDDKNGKIYHVTRYDKDGTYYLGQFLISFDQETYLIFIKTTHTTLQKSNAKSLKKRFHFGLKN